MKHQFYIVEIDEKNKKAYLYHDLNDSGDGEEFDLTQGDEDDWWFFIESLDNEYEINIHCPEPGEWCASVYESPESGQIDMRSEIIVETELI